MYAFFRSPTLNSYIIDMRSFDEKIINILDFQFLHGYYEPTVFILYEPYPTWAGYVFVDLFSHRVGGNRKRYQQSTNTDQKSIETVFSSPIYRQCGDKWQSKILFIMIFDLRSSIVLAFLLAA